ncbi:MAG TPA: LysR substrate-binding domain-containing protein [Candidatus Acidoferrum sp.]|jgi:DNA-binding transcriptional LysR family regulator|nr:LysR substrate-binding domain-containing protein [Candidatus Acidoferrum sp.]
MAQLENFRLKVFRAVAEHLNFRKAAEQLFLTQPAVTLQIKALENDLGVRLFDRAAGRISLTRQGSVLLGYANKIAALVSEAERELVTDDCIVSGELSLGVSTTIAQYVLPRLLGAFLAEHPRVQLSLHSGNTEKIVQCLVDGKASIGLIEGPARNREVRTEPFMEDAMVLIVPPDFEFDRLTHDQLLSAALLMRELGSGSRRVVESALEKAGFKLKSFKSVMNLDSTEAIKSAVEAGLGIGFVSRWAVSKELELGLLKVAEVKGLRIVRHFSLVSHAGPEPQGACGAFREFALARAQILSNTPKQPVRSPSSSR